MTKAELARIAAWRLRILQHAEGEPRLVARTCRYFGISCTAFYRWKQRYDEFGEAMGSWIREHHPEWWPAERLMMRQC